MRVTAKGVLLGGSVGVLITTTLLWSQCRPPHPKVNNGMAQDTGGENQELRQQQKHRQPLMMTNQQTDVLRFEGDEYTDDFRGVAPPRVPPPLRHLGDQEMSRHDGRNEQDEGGEEGEGLRDDVENEDEEVGYPMSEIACVINRETSVSCRRDETDIFIPFSFIHNYFEVYGRLATNDRGQEVFEWSHSYSNVFEPTTQYRPISKFLNFQSFNVEARERVKCISAIEGVPISTQWQSSGYTYPIQIAQYGLSHYSKYLEEPPPKRIVIEDGRKRKASWKYDSKEASISRVLRKDLGGYVMKFNTLGRQGEKGIGLSLSSAEAPADTMVLNTYLRLLCLSNKNSSLTLVLQTSDKKLELFYIHYVCSEKLIETKEQHIFYGLGLKDEWRFLTRNIMVDLLKGIAASSRAKKLKK
ncbi:hypothetical protein Anas_02573, partial [Armadillidium nasatum]